MFCLCGVGVVGEAMQVGRSVAGSCRKVGICGVVGMVGVGE